MEDHIARLAIDALGGTVDMNRPAHGIVDVRLGNELLGGARLLSIMLSELPAGDMGAPTQWHTRGMDLAATWKQSAASPVQIDAMWRAVSPAPSDEFLAAVDLIVSVRTQSPRSRAELKVGSALNSAETLRLVRHDPVRYETVTLWQGTPAVLQPADGSGCLLFRLPDRALSYAEMVHPADFQQSQLTGEPGDKATTCLIHRLFSGELEKGVILRARIRGVFVPRNEDTRIAAASYADFAAAEPPLAT